MAIRLLALALLLCTALVAGCNRTDGYLEEQPVSIMQTAFDPQASAYVKELGSASITGTGSITVAGRTYYAQGSRFMLVPVTAYSTEYIGYLFGGSPSYDTPRDIENVDSRFVEYMRFAQGGEGGHFVMYGVPPGDYYLYVAIPDPAERFYGVHRRITVVEGQTLDIALDGT
jgi:hypothetical protein